jgi:hypothetical protein
MTQLLELVHKLTDRELREVQDFAEFLLQRRSCAPNRSPTDSKDSNVNFEGWAGCLAHVHPEMSDSQFKQLILDERAKEADE